MYTAMAYYDMFPKVVKVGERTLITVRPLGRHACFEEDGIYSIDIVPMAESNANQKSLCYPRLPVKANGGCIIFAYVFESEQRYSVHIQDENEKDLAELFIYALAKDLHGLIPYRGDLHVHTFHSDGKESPEFVAAYYRKEGFDFLSITDHGKYFPSLEAIDAFKDTHIDFKIFPGEEVHLPENNSHIVNFAGDFSVNEWVARNTDLYYEEVSVLQKSLDIPEGINAYEYASCVWAYQKIRESKGMAILPHPHWIQDYAYHVREGMIWHLFETRPFDAFEVVGGQSLQENAMQIALYNESRARGLTIPIVGSSDSHGVIHGEWFNRAKTIVLAKSMQKEDIIEAIKKMHSVALEQYPGESFPRIYGSYRLTGYVLFLLENYFPLHDELCFEEGRLMNAYANGEQGAKEALERLYGRTKALAAKYIDC